MGFLPQHDLRIACDPARKLIGGTDDAVEGQRSDALGAAQHGGGALGGHPQHVHPWVDPGLGEPRCSAMHLHGCRVGLAACTDHHLRPKPPRCAELRHLTEEIVRHRVAESDLASRRVDAHARIGELSKVLDSRRDGVGELLDDACAAAVVRVARDVRSAEARCVLGAPHGQIPKLRRSRAKPTLDASFRGEQADRVEAEAALELAVPDPAALRDREEPRGDRQGVRTAIEANRSRLEVDGRQQLIELVDRQHPASSARPGAQPERLHATFEVLPNHLAANAGTGFVVFLANPPTA